MYKDNALYQTIFYNVTIYLAHCFDPFTEIIAIHCYWIIYTIIFIIRTLFYYFFFIDLFFFSFFSVLHTALVFVFCVLLR